MAGTNDLSPEAAWIFRITHIDNVQWIIEHGLHCRSSSTTDPNYHDIGNRDLIALRADRSVPKGPGGTLSDYIPFYFTPHSPMLLNIKTGFHGMKQTPMQDIVILATSLHKLHQSGVEFVFTDRHAYLTACTFCDDLEDLGLIDWAILRARDFKRNASDPGKMERYQAEALAYQHVPVEAFEGIICYGSAEVARVEALLKKEKIALKVIARPGYYF
jgi:ssDNA thymidine ADP-ribosyltransferase, DarT